MLLKKEDNLGKEAISIASFELKMCLPKIHMLKSYSLMKLYLEIGRLW
jgi:hypothetical protein